MGEETDVPSVGSRTLAAAMSAVGRKLGYRDLDQVRRKVEKQLTRPAHFGPPAQLARKCRVDISFDRGFPCYTVSPRDREPRVQVLYLHGGAYIEEIGANHWAFVKELAAQAPARVVVPVYPLAPRGTAEGFLPELAALARELTRGELPAVFMGDSAGGGLALAAAQRLRTGGDAPPSRLILVSPWLDATLADDAADAIEPHDPMLAREPLRWAGRLWAGALDPSDPAVSPLHGDMTGLPVTEVYAGDRDILLVDARRFRDRARAAGVTVELEEAAGQIHVYPLWPVPEGRAARERVLAGLRRTAGLRTVSGGGLGRPNRTV